MVCMASSQEGLSELEVHTVHLFYERLLQRWTAQPVCPRDCTLCDPPPPGVDALLCDDVSPIETALLWTAALLLTQAVPHDAIDEG